MSLFCIKCGYRNDDGANFCIKCGTPLIYDDDPAPDGAMHRSGDSQRIVSKKRKKSKAKEETSTIRMILAFLIVPAFMAIAGIMLYQVYSRQDASSDIISIEEPAAGRQGNTQENWTEQPGETETGPESEQVQAPYMEIYDDEGGIIVVDGQSVASDSIDKPTSSSTDSFAVLQGGQGDTDNIAVNMEPVDQGTFKAPEQESTQTVRQTPTTVSLLTSQAGPDLSGYQRVSVVNASASGTIAQTERDNYPMVLFDGRDDSSWQEGVEGYGIGEWVSWNMDRKYNIKYIGFKMGNWSSDYYYYGNARPKTIVLTAGDFTGQVTFTNERAVQWVELSNEVTADSMRIQINDVFPGTTRQDTCITEILVYGK